MQPPLTRAMLSRDDDLKDAVYKAYKEVCSETGSDPWTRRQVRMQWLSFRLGMDEIECRHILSFLYESCSPGQCLRHQTPCASCTTSQVLEQIPGGVNLGKERDNRLFIAAFSCNAPILLAVLRPEKLLVSPLSARRYIQSRNRG